MKITEKILFVVSFFCIVFFPIAITVDNQITGLVKHFSFINLFIGILVCLIILSAVQILKLIPKQEFRLFSLGFLAINIPWLMILPLIPRFWLGITDGYLYSMQIHESRFGQIFGDWSSTGLVAYPPYLYSTWGTLLRGISPDVVSQGLSFAILFPISISLGYLALYMSFSKLDLNRKYLGLWATAPILGLVIFRDHWIIEKPHEILALSLAISFVLMSSSRGSLNSKDGILLGLVFGLYTSYFLLLIPLIIIQSVKTPIKQFFRFSIFGLVFGGPWFIILIYNKLENGIVGIPGYFTGYDLRGDYLNFTDGVTLWILMLLTSYFISNNAVSRNLNIFAFTSLLGIYLSFGLLRMNVVVNSAVNWQNVFTSICFLSICLSIQNTGKFSEFRINKYSYYAFPLVFFFSIMSNTAPFSLLSTIRFSEARASNVHYYAEALSKLEFTDGSKYLGFGEGMFVNHSLSNSLKPVFFFNNSYVSFTNVEALASDFNNAAQGEKSFIQWLTMNRVCVIMPGKSNKGFFSSELSLNTSKLNENSDTNQINLMLLLPEARIAEIGEFWIPLKTLNGSVYLDRACIKGSNLG